MFLSLWNWPVSLGLQDLLLVCRTGGIELRRAGDGVLLVSDHGLDQLNGTAQAQIAGVEAVVVALHRAPLAGRIVLVIG